MTRLLQRLFLPHQEKPVANIITLMNKTPGYSVTPELLQMARKTNDPAQRRDQAIRFFSATYYQKAIEFSDILTATFPPVHQVRHQYAMQARFACVSKHICRCLILLCKVWRLVPQNPLYQTTMAHNRLFNPPCRVIRKSLVLNRIGVPVHRKRRCTDMAPGYVIAQVRMQKQRRSLRTRRSFK